MSEKTKDKTSRDMHIRHSGNESKNHYEMKKLLADFLHEKGFNIYPEGRFKKIKPLAKNPDIVAYRAGLGTFFIEITFSRYKLIPDI